MEIYKTAADMPKEITLPEHADMIALVGLISRMCIGEDVTVEDDTNVTLGVAQGPEFYEYPQYTCIFGTRIGNAVIGAGTELRDSTVRGYYDNGHPATLGEGNIIESSKIIGHVTIGDRNIVGVSVGSENKIVNISRIALKIGDGNQVGDNVLIQSFGGGSIGNGNHIEESCIMPRSIGDNNSIRCLEASGAKNITIGSHNKIGTYDPSTPNRFSGSGIVIADNVKVGNSNTFIGSSSRDGDGLVIADNTIIRSNKVVVGPENCDCLMVMEPEQL